MPTITATQQRRKTPARSSLPSYPVVYGSLIEPSGRCTRWRIITGPCGHCGGRHLHYAPSAAAAGGARRAGCGGTYWVVVARTYKRKPTGLQLIPGGAR